jgi:hypothetical protein
MNTPTAIIPSSSTPTSPVDTSRIAISARAAKLIKDLNHRDAKEAKTRWGQIKGTTLDMKGYDWLHDQIDSGKYSEGQILFALSLAIELWGNPKTDARTREIEKKAKVMIPVLVEAFINQNHGRETIQPHYVSGKLVGLKMPQTIEDRNTYLNRLNHQAALANGKVERTLDSLRALPSSNPVKLIENKFEAKIEAKVPVSSTAGPDVHADVGRYVEDETSPASATGATTSGD